MLPRDNKQPWFRKSYFPDNLSSFRSLQLRAHMSTQETVDCLGVTVRTHRRWLKENPPEWARLLLAIRAGHMPWAEWQGWQVTDEGLAAPGHFQSPLPPGHILAMHFKLQELSAYKRAAREFLSMVDQAEFIEQWRRDNKRTARSQSHKSRRNTKYEFLFSSNRTVLLRWKYS